MTKEKCLAYLEEGIELLQEMKDILESAESDSPQAFLEAAHDVQDRVNKAIAEAIIPIIQERNLHVEDR
ncbi:hypothetical protein [Noviherbaspirillum sp. Root189]|uniref:hypothetical protein n=1 Tax=Noviherbaspirillum sp. Root189 TaxID=1736487 RepID=UPI00070E0B7C|nr:hypothetical protein [Noviherbaspirillum sp. Root189]KRB67015.1 hypothetical protein ASE07_27670 [Noviherbaspirillum sp. Root189]